MSSANRITLSDVADVLTDVMDVPVAEDEDFRLDNLNPWDSLKQIEAILVLEEEFGVRLSVDEMARLDTLGELVDALWAASDHA